MGFKVKDALEIRDKILALDRSVTLKELQNMLREHTGSMMPWWIQTYTRSMVSSGMIVLLADNTFGAIRNWKPIVH